MNIRATSDLHGYLPIVPVCETLIIAGDVCPDNPHTLGDAEKCSAIQYEWLMDAWMPWRKNIPATHVVMVWGNHDFIGQSPKYVEPFIKEASKYDVHLLQDSGVTINGIYFWGTPWVTNIPAWAFNKHSTGEIWHYMPQSIDVLVTHAPPLGIGDRIYPFGNVGDPHMRAALDNREVLGNLPRLHVFGHIHEAQGSCGN